MPALLTRADVLSDGVRGNTWQEWFHGKFGHISPYVAEFCGTMMLTLTVCCNFMGHTTPRTKPTWVPTANGCMLMVATYALAPVSGAHLNPAVSLAVGFANKGSWRTLFSYMLCQVAGGILGAWIAMWEYKDVPRNAVGPGPGFSVGDVFLIELVFTMMLCFVYLNVTLARSNNPVEEGNQYYGLAVGFVLIAGGYAASNISGAYFNPAVTIGIEFANVVDGIGYAIFYLVIQCLGAVFSALIFRILRPAEDFEETKFRGYENDLHVKCLCEGFGTFFIVFTVGLSDLGGNEVMKPWSTAAAITSLMYALSDVSGAHFNPAITLSLSLIGRHRSIREVFMYILSQCMFGIIGALLYTEVYGGKNDSLVDGHMSGHGGKYSLTQMALTEFVFTFLIVYVYMSVACVKGIVGPLKRNYYHGLAVGMCVAAGGFSVGAVSGAVINPATAIATSFAHLVDHGAFWPCIVYSGVQFAGGMVAAVLFRVTHSGAEDAEMSALCAQDAPKDAEEGLKYGSRTGASSHATPRQPRQSLQAPGRRRGTPKRLTAKRPLARPVESAPSGPLPR